jgi:predicted amidophosphoribosyltransferase
MSGCARCGEEIRERFRFCPGCGTPLRRKLVELFPAALERDGGRALRVSRYLGPEPAARHVRFSVWSPEGVAEGVVSLSEQEGARLARFLLDHAAEPAADEAPTLPGAGA